MESINFDEFMPIPTNPAYWVAEDGRVLSFKKRVPQLLAEHRTPSPVWWRVRIAGREVRIRDLVFILFGSSDAFEQRAWDWIADNPADEED